MSWTLHPYRLPLRIPYRWAKGSHMERHGLLVGHAADGFEGFGETAPPPHEGTTGEELQQQAQAVVDEIHGSLPLERQLDSLQAPPRIRNGLLSAWLDVRARRHGVPLGIVLAERYGIERRPAATVPVNALIPALDAKPAAAAAVQAVRDGFRTLKVKSDADLARDLARLQAIRAAVGESVAIRIDANESWDPSHCLEHLQAIAPFNVEYVEQPLRAGRFDALATLCRTSPVPIALDESMTSWAVAERFLAAGTRPILVLKPQRLGGPDRVLTAVRKAETAGLRCVITNSLESAVGRTHALHLAALLPAPISDCGLGTGSFLAHDVATEPELKAGHQHVPTGPGLGLVPRLEALRAPDIPG